MDQWARPTRYRRDTVTEDCLFRQATIRLFIAIRYTRNTGSSKVY